MFKLALGPPCHFSDTPERKTTPRSAGVPEPPQPRGPLNPWGGLYFPPPRGPPPRTPPASLSSQRYPTLSRTLHSPPVSWAGSVVPSACHLAPFWVTEGTQCHRRTWCVPLGAQHNGGTVSLQLDTGLTRHSGTHPRICPTRCLGPVPSPPHVHAQQTGNHHVTSGPLHAPVEDASVPCAAGPDPPLPLCCPHLSQPRAVPSPSGFQESCNPQVSEASPSSSGGPEPPSAPWSWCPKPAPISCQGGHDERSVSIPRAWGPCLQPPQTSGRKPEHASLRPTSRVLNTPC